MIPLAHSWSETGTKYVFPFRLTNSILWSSSRAILSLGSKRAKSIYSCLMIFCLIPSLTWARLPYNYRLQIIDSYLSASIPHSGKNDYLELARAQSFFDLHFSITVVQNRRYHLVHSALVFHGTTQVACYHVFLPDLTPRNVSSPPQLHNLQ